MRNSLPIVRFVLCLWLLPLLAQARTWTSQDGRTLEADLIAKTVSTVTLRRQGDGREFAVTIASLSPADREYIAGWQPADVPPPRKAVTEQQIADLVAGLPEIKNPRAPLEANYPNVVDFREKYSRALKQMRPATIPQTLAIVREMARKDADILLAITKTVLTNPPILTPFGWSKGSGSWKESYSAQANLNWLTSELPPYLSRFEDLSK